MTHSVVRVSAIALGVATLVSLSPLSKASADTSTPSEAASPIGATSATGGATAVQHRAVTAERDYTRPNIRHYRTVWRNGHRKVYYGHNPVVAATTGVVGGVADLASLAAYPIYCFPHYGSCPVYLPY